MENILRSILNLLVEITPVVKEAGIVAKIIQTLVDITPVVIKEAKDLAPLIKQAVSVLKGNTVTDEQLAQLDALEAQIDAEFDSAVAKAEEDDKAG